MLDAVAHEDLRAAIVAVNRDGHGDRTFRELESVAIVGGDLKIIRHQVKLLAGHAEGRMVVDVHRATLAGSVLLGNNECYSFGFRASEFGFQVQGLNARRFNWEKSLPGLPPREERELAGGESRRCQNAPSMPAVG